jgi:hypothetical protein
LQQLNQQNKKDWKIILRVELPNWSNEESWNYTSFLFDSILYQLKRVPYGFKNSFSAFLGHLSQH